MPASGTPIASATAMQPAGIASMAARVDFGEDQDSGVARSSRAGTKRSVKARPTSRFCPGRSEEHTSELQSLMRISYAVFCLKKKRHDTINTNENRSQKDNRYEI